MLRYLEDEDQGKRRRRPGRGEDRRRGGVRLGPGWGRVGCVGVGGASARCTQVCSVDGVWGRGWGLGGAKLRRGEVLWLWPPWSRGLPPTLPLSQRTRLSHLTSASGASAVACGLCSSAAASRW